MPVAPTPPTKPTPPVAPAHATTGDSSSAATAAGAASTSSTSSTAKQVNPGVAGVADKIEGLGKAFQGNTAPANPAQNKETKKNEPAGINNQNQAGVTAPMNSFATQNNVAAQTTAPAKVSAIDNQSSSFSYLPFLGILVIAALILVGMRLFKNRTATPRTSIAYHKNSDKVTPKEGLNIVASPDSKGPKAKSSFEVRV